ncbi:glycosyltransferase [Bifidobacterium catenulatum]|uniref:glycosyltransferase n=1 Tax=Bifidobacterium catenulatum TaxID=1686 RepID=UPI0011829E85|nr:glycosyltransferase [Bifidobacterium catenulatum]MZM93374.1 glycosyltransferase [Bifidobacterium pseudocatenulatum]MZM96789.1 glycosyltransferase [Bifidobacterium pseudocatenulatum]MZN03565.1 glycosyltransferase [Bifidobacterium pseudocatenulatum]MZN14020.1 glycosyltransferase [Bifidobacterium pseudocatenulatum]MZN27714.1 glycosyltransferase [Bifidobacterium pseudocatenulatum]
MTSMKFANVLLETNPRSVAYPALYCRSDHPVIFNETQGEWEMHGAGTFDFSTYFNSLSVRKLKQFTKAKSFTLHLELKGAACEVQQTMGDAFAHDPIEVEGVHRGLSASRQWQSVDMPLTITDDMVIVGFIIRTEGSVDIRNSYYELEIDGDLNDVELVLSTTTFKKEAFIERNIGLVKEQIVESADPIAKHFHMYVMDNGRTLDAEKLTSDRITVIPNDNVGGAGGFTRGMITAMEQDPKATNILLMDDDVAVSPESIKRTYNLLRILKEEHREDMVSGAMLNYEVGEDQWEDIGNMTPQGTFAGCKPGMRLTLFEDLIYNEMFTPTKWQRNNMYAAWWYCCIPISVIEKNGLPLPVFVRCDDAEYGIRCKTGFITMNSLCVWHMSFFERYNAAVERYQTTRNTMIAQATCGMAPDADFMKELHNNIRLELKKFGYANAELCLDAFEDFLKGPEFIKKPGQSEKSFMVANRNKEQLVDFETLQSRADQDPELAGFSIKNVDRQLIDGDKSRSLAERLEDLITDNNQRYIKKDGAGYAVIPLQGWLYPAGAIRGKHKLVVLDWYNRKGTIRTKDVQRYQKIKKRYMRDLKYYKANINRLRKEYAAARVELTSVEYWKNYLKMD